MSGFVQSLTVLTFGLASEGGSITEQHLFFKTREAAALSMDAALQLFNEGSADTVTVLDDYDTRLTITSFVYARVSDMEKAMEVGVEQSLLQARAQAKSNQRASQDPVLALVSGAANQPQPGFRPQPGRR